MVEWRPINDMDGYLVSDDGRIYSLKRNKELVVYKRKDGYLSITLGAGRKGVVKRYLVHRLVAMAFVPNPCGYPRINHKDENKGNNRADNLEWCTDKYNANYGTRNKRAKQNHNWIKAGEKLSKPVLQYTTDGELVGRYTSVADVERKTGFYKLNIYDCCRGYSSRGKRHTAYGYIWKYEEE